MTYLHISEDMNFDIEGVEVEDYGSRLVSNRVFFSFKPVFPFLTCSTGVILVFPSRTLLLLVVLFASVLLLFWLVLLFFFL